MSPICNAVVLSAAVLAIGAAAAEGSHLLRPCFRNLTPEVREELWLCAEKGAAWEPHDGRTKMFIRGQFYYGNQYANYIHAWYERPLHQDTSMASQNEPGRMLNVLSWKRTVQTAREMNLDGFAFFPLNPGCLDLFPRSQMPGGEVVLLMQFTGSNLRDKYKECMQLAERYRSMPNAYRIDGKPVIVGYPDLFVTDEKIYNLWLQYKRSLENKYGRGAFVVMPGVRIFDLPDLDRPEMDIGTIRKTQDRIRKVLRDMDGLFICQWELNWGHPSNLAVPMDQIVVPLVRSIMAEPEFRGKRLGYEFYQAHENPYRRVADLASGGMTRLRSSLESIEKLKPDFAFGSEWDEENENVHFRPTVSNGQTTQRIMRYYAERMAGSSPTPYPGDDVSIPNLILAYRKMLAVGEPLEAQVVGVPDGTDVESYQVSLSWRTLDGIVVKSFPEQTLSMSGCNQLSFMCSTVDVADHRILVPELTVASKDGKRHVYDYGFWPLSIDAIRVLDNKWVRHSLREISQGVIGTLSIGAQAKDGSYVVRGSVNGKRRFRSVEVLETSDSVYMYNSASATNKSDDVNVSVGLSALGNYWKAHCPTGWVRILNAPHARPRASAPAYAVSGGQFEWRLPKRSIPVWSSFSDYGFYVPRTEAEGAIVEVGLPGEIGIKRISVADLMSGGPYSYGLPGGGQIVAKVKLSENDIPPPANVSQTEFSFKMKPLDPTAVLRLQIVDEDYRVWRGPVASFYSPSGKSAAFHVYDELSSSRRAVSLDSRRLYKVKYDFGSQRGDMVDDVGGRADSPCVFGGSISRVTGVGAGGCNYQHALSESNPNFSSMPGGGDTVPRCVLTDGVWSLAFTNCNFATLPMQFIPRHSGWELSMSVWPERTDGKMYILDSGNLGCNLWIEDGVPQMFLSFFDEMLRKGLNETAGITVKGPRLAPRRWNKLKVVFDQQSAWIEVDGKRGEPVAGCGHEGNPHAYALGCSVGGTGFFYGRLADIKVSPCFDKIPHDGAISRAKKGTKQ